MKHVLKTVTLSAACLTAALSLTACSGAKEQLGLTRQAPDEFAVVKRAPLAMPPDYSLRPPKPGAARPQETAATAQAREVVFGNSTTQTTDTQAPASDSAESYLLEKTGAATVDPGIRDIVDAETRTLAPKEQPVAKRLLNWGKDATPPAEVVDAKAEAARLQKNKEEGAPVTEGETPSIEE